MKLLVVGVVVLVVACDSGSTGGRASAQPPDASPSASAPVTERPPERTSHRASEALERCSAARRASPSSIEDVLAALSAMPTPVDGPCYVATLPRPLAVVATIGVTSAQPAAGKSSPRLFFLLPKVVISAVPEGDGSKVMELGEWMTPTRTLKGELELPVTAPLRSDSAFRHVLSSGGYATICATCHREEAPHPSIPDAFVSAAYKPEPGTFVTLGELEALHDDCARRGDNGGRCALFHAVFDFGAVIAGTFAPEVETFFAP